MERCTVSKLLGGKTCAGALADVAEVGGEQITTCSVHWHLAGPLVAELERRRRPKRRRCHHKHVSADARAQCERRLQRATV
jgi:hypothetical protein